MTALILAIPYTPQISLKNVYPARTPEILGNQGGTADMVTALTQHPPITAMTHWMAAGRIGAKPWRQVQDFKVSVVRHRADPSVISPLIRLFPRPPTARLHAFSTRVDLSQQRQIARVADLVLGSKLVNMRPSGRPMRATTRANRPRGCDVTKGSAPVALGDAADGAPGTHHWVGAGFFGHLQAKMLRLGPKTRQNTIDKEERIS